MKVQQVELLQIDNGGRALMVCWVDIALRLKRGNIVTGKLDHIKWKVIEVYETIEEHDHINREWKVGGL